MRGLVLAVLLAGVAHAGDFAQPVIIGVTSTMTIVSVSIATQTPTSVIGSLKPLYRQVCIQNLDWNASLSCSESVSISTIPTSASYGLYITTASAASLSVAPPCFEVVPGNNFYCLSSSVSKASTAVVIRKR